MKKYIVALIIVMTALFGIVYAAEEAKGISFINENGDKAFSCEQGKELKAIFNGDNQNACMVVAWFDSTEKLCGVKTVSGDTLACDFVPDENCDVVKAFVFDGMDTLKPVCESAELDKRDISKNLLISSKNSVFGEDTYDTNPTYQWVCDGNMATDVALALDTQELFDGDSSTARMSSFGMNNDSYGNIIIHLDTPMEISKVSVRATCADYAYVKSFDVYASENGEIYNYIASVENKMPEIDRVMALNCEISRPVVAKDIKIVMKKKPEAYFLNIAEVEVYGRPPEKDKVRCTDYKYEQDVAYLTSTDITNNDYTKKALSDNDITKTVEALGDYVNLIYTFDDFYQIDNIDIFGNSLGAEILTSPDGVNYRNAGYYDCTDGKISACGIPGRNAKYVKLIVRKGDLPKIELSEVYVYGRKLFDNMEQPKPETDRVQVYTELKSNNILYIDWTDYDEEANNINDGYFVYIEKSDFTDASKKTPKSVFENGNGNAHARVDGRYCCFAGLEPDTDYYVAVAPRNNTEAQQDVRTVKIHTYTVLAGEKLSSVFCINDYPTGGGAHVEHDDDNAMIETKLKLLNAMEAMHNTRWWYPITDNYRANGINFLHEGTGDVAGNNAKGSYLFGTFNEPDISAPYKNDPKLAVQKMKENHEKAQAVDTRNVSTGPTTCGTDTLPWIRSLYKEDPNFGDYFEAMDIHLYCKLSEGNTHADDSYNDFETHGVPEHLIGKANRIRSLLSDCEGNPNKPIISSEIGWATHNQSGSWAEKVTYDRQADYVVRCYLNSITAGIVNTYIYAFQDEGYETDYSEYQYGMVDWYGNPKPAYYTAYTLMKMIKNAEYMGGVSGIYHPNYAITFWDETRSKYITAIWTADGQERKINIYPDEDYRVVDAYGNTTRKPQGEKLQICKSPKYIISDNWLSVTN